MLASISSAHPRVSGENLTLEGEDEAGLGSSPRERGKPLRELAFHYLNGLIPA